MKGNRNTRMIKRATDLQNKIENYLGHIPELSFVTYLQFSAMVCFIMGIGMFLYCELVGKNFLLVVTLHNPLFYLCLGFTIFCFYLWEKFNPSDNCLK